MRYLAVLRDIWLSRKWPQKLSKITRQTQYFKIEQILYKRRTSNTFIPTTYIHQHQKHNYIHLHRKHNYIYIHQTHMYINKLVHLTLPIWQELSPDNCHHCHSRYHWLIFNININVLLSLVIIPQI